MCIFHYIDKHNADFSNCLMLWKYQLWIKIINYSLWDEWRSTVCFVWTAGTRRNNPTGSICLPYIFQLFLLESDVRVEDFIWFSLFSVLFTDNSWGGRISSHISELLIKTWGVEGPGDEREDTIPPPSETEDVLREYTMDWEFLKFVELFEFRREKSFEVRREDSVFCKYQFHAFGFT